MAKRPSISDNVAEANRYLQEAFMLLMDIRADFGLDWRAPIDEFIARASAAELIESGPRDCPDGCCGDCCN